MASLALSAIGGMIGGPIGYLAGSLLGNLLFPQKIEGPRLKDLKLHTSSYGQMTPLLYGTMRVAGNVIDEQPELTEHSDTEGGKGGPEVTNYTYSASFAVRLCEGPIRGIRKVWANGRLIYDIESTDLPSLPMTIYLGDEVQLPDPTLETIHGTGNVPGYRGIAYVVFTDLLLTDYGNALPNLNFEVYTNAGDIPIRISTFSGHLDYYSGVSGVTFDRATNVITTASYGGGVYSRRSFTFPDGTPTGTDVDAALPAGVVYGIVSNLDVAIFQLAPDPSAIFWMVNGGLAHSILDSPIPTSKGYYQNGIIYFPVAGGVVGWSAPGGVPAGGSIVYSVTLSGASSMHLNGGTDGNIYVFSNGNGVVYKLSPDLTILKAWVIGTDIPSISLAYTGGGFFFYNGVLVTNVGTFSQFRMNLLSVDAADNVTLFDQPRTGTTPDFEWAGGDIVYLGGGYVLGKDGIALIGPPVTGVTLGSIVENISLRCGLEVDEIDVSTLTDIVDGYLLTQQATGRDMIQPLRNAWFFDGVESDDVIKFVKRGGGPVAEIPVEDLAAHSDNEEVPPTVETVRAQELDLPKTVTLNYINAAADYQTGTQFAQRQASGIDVETTLDLPISMTDSKAKSVVDTWLYTAWVEREKHTITTSRKWALYEPTDVLTADGLDVRINSKREIRSGVIRYECVTSIPSIQQQVGAGVAGQGFIRTPADGSVPGTVADRGATTAYLLDLPLVNDADAPNGFYAAMWGGAGWPGASLMKSVDSGTTYSAIASSTTSAVIGTTSGALDGFEGGNVFDEANIVTVVTTGGTLSSATEEAVLNGANPAVIGNEILQFKNAELVDTNTYELSGLLRGRLGTEWAMNPHGAGEKFALLPVLRPPSPSADLNIARYYKPVTIGATAASTVAQGFTNSGNALRPYSPVLLGGGTNAAGDVTLTWTRRTRIGGVWAPLSDVPLSETSESYVVQIWNSDYTQVARVITGVTSQTATYTSAQQVADFGAQQQTIYFTVAQVGAVLGRSQRGTAVGAGSTDDDPISAVPPYQSPTSGSSDPPPTFDSLDLSLDWTLAGNQRTYSNLAGNFACDKIVVCQFTTPAGTSANVGSIGAAEWNSGAGPIVRTACLSSIPGDFSGNDLGANSLVHGISVTVQFTVGPNSRSFATPELSPSTTYYFNVKNDNGFGACTCFSTDCNIFVELRKPSGL